MSINGEGGITAIFTTFVCKSDIFRTIFEQRLCPDWSEEILSILCLSTNSNTTKKASIAPKYYWAVEPKHRWASLKFYKDYHIAYNMTFCYFYMTNPSYFIHIIYSSKMFHM